MTLGVCFEADCLLCDEPFFPFFAFDCFPFLPRFFFLGVLSFFCLLFVFVSFRWRSSFCSFVGFAFGFIFSSNFAQISAVMFDIWFETSIFNSCRCLMTCLLAILFCFDYSYTLILFIH